MKTIIAIAALAAIAAGANAATFNYSFDEGVAWTSAIFVYGTPTGTPGEYTATQSILPGTISGNGSFDVDGLQSGDIYAFLDSYQDVAGGSHVGVALNPASASSLIGSDFQTAFGISESDALTAIAYIQMGLVNLNGQTISTSDANFGALFAFVPTYTPGEVDPILGWSTGAQIGTVTVQSVPEPSAFAALGLGALALLKRRRR